MTVDVGKPVLSDLRFSPDGSTFHLTALDPNPRPPTPTKPWVVRTWNTETWRESTADVAPVPQPWRSFERVGAVSHDGRIVATLDPYAPDVMLWDAVTGAKLSSLLTPLVPPATGNYVCEFSPDRLTLAVGRNSLGLLELWDLPTRKARQTLRGLGRGDRIESVRFASGSSRNLVSTVSNWDFATSLVWQVIDKLERSVFGKPVRMIPNDVVVWDMQTVRVRARLKGETWGIISADGSTLATGGYGGVTLWDITSK